MFRLAHLSDIHLAPIPQPNLRQLATKRITGYVNYRRHRAKHLRSEILDDLVEDMKCQNPDHVAVTGDLVNIGLPREIANATDWLASLGNPDIVSLVPGNHDAYVPGALKAALAQWHPNITNIPTVEAGHTVSKDPFPFRRICGPVAVIGCNSARATAPFMATGFFRKPQARRLKEQLLAAKQNGLFRIVMIHHPPFTKATHWHKRLVGERLFRQVIGVAGAELVLHGHTHLDSIAQIKGPVGPVPVIGVPAAAQAPGGRRPAARYNLFDIERKMGVWACTMTERGYSERGQIEQIRQRQISGDCIS